MIRIALLVALAACARRSPPQATAADAQRGSVALADLEQGRRLLVTRCGGCHDTPLPKDHDAAEWPKYVADMAPKAKLDAAERAQLERYLIVMAEAP